MQLEKLATFKGSPGPVLLVVADGVGIAPSGPANAVTLANTPTMDTLLSSDLGTRLYAHGTWVGLPGDGDMGNSEVGHNALGSGQIISQGAKLVNQAFDSGTIFESSAWQTVEQRGEDNGVVHFLGLLSDGNIHSHIDHLLALIDRCHATGIQSVRLHCLLDGRDVEPRSALTYIAQLQQRLDQINSDDDRDYLIASAGGRMVITMDRYEADWSMVERGYRCHVQGDANAIVNITAEIQRQYDEDPKLTDQNLQPFVVADQDGSPVGAMADGDAVVLFNFRGDRAIEISRALQEASFDEFDRDDHPAIFFCGMLEYDGDLHMPTHFLVNPPIINDTMVEYLCAENIRSFAVSETQKFGHVTYFWNGNRSDYIDEELETWVEIPSDNVAFNEAPEMKAQEITDATIELLRSGEYRFGRINFANGDMVGHTGDIDATVRAIETVDRCLGQLLDVMRELDGVLVYTADHGNADEMFIEKQGKRVTRTSHSLNQVPFVIAPAAVSPFRLNKNMEGGLANVAATVFNLLGFRAPAVCEPSLLELEHEPRSRRLIHNGVLVNLGLETVKLPNGEILALEVVRHPGGAVVIAMNPKREICLLKQFRHAAGGWIWEFPAGTLENFEQPAQTAFRELQEEAGCTADDLVSLGSTLTTPGFCSERLFLYLAENVEQGTATPEQYEFIEVHWLPLDRINKMAATGEIEDAKTIVALYRLNHYLGAN